MEGTDPRITLLRACRATSAGGRKANRRVTSIGAACAVNTTADALVPGTVTEGARAVWQLGQVQLFDGGADGVASTTGDNTLFETQGVFAP